MRFLRSANNGSEPFLQPFPGCSCHLRGIQVHTSDAECACRLQVIHAQKPQICWKSNRIQDPQIYRNLPFFGCYKPSQYRFIAASKYALVTLLELLSIDSLYIIVRWWMTPIASRAFLSVMHPESRSVGRCWHKTSTHLHSTGLLGGCWCNGTGVSSSLVGRNIYKGQPYSRIIGTIRQAFNTF